MKWEIRSRGLTHSKGLSEANIRLSERRHGSRGMHKLARRQRDGWVAGQIWPRPWNDRSVVQNNRNPSELRLSLY
jgi:hypothetical protein